MSKPKSRTVTCRVVGTIPVELFNGVAWKVRLKAPRLPFYIDSAMCYATKAEADAEAAEWRKRTVTITIGATP